MPNDRRRIDLKKDLNIKKDLIINKDLNIKDKDIEITNPVTDMNIVLTKDQINSIIREVLGPKGEKFDPRAIGSDHCCVDVSVGSSVAGPFTGVASAVSIPTPQGTLVNGKKIDVLKSQLINKIDGKGIKVTVPTNIKFK